MLTLACEICGDTSQVWHYGVMAGTAAVTLGALALSFFAFRGRRKAKA